MKAITTKSPHDTSFSFSRRYFHWKGKMEDEDGDEEQENLNFSSYSHVCDQELSAQELDIPVSAPRKKLFKLRPALTFRKSRSKARAGLGNRVVVTLFGRRRGNVRLSFQDDPKLNPAFLVELATPTSALVREMASGVVRIALECEKKKEKKGSKLLEEPIWRTYCNGKKYGYAMRCDCGPEEWKVLSAVAPVSMGAGMLPGTGNGAGRSEGEGEGEGELMYMRAKFERVAGSRDSEAFYMINPDGRGGPQLSIYFLRV